MKENSMVLIDTNILVYAFDSSEPHKNKIAKEFLQACWNGEKQAAISLQNINECYAVLTTKVKRPLARGVAKEIINGFLRMVSWAKLVPTGKTSSRAISIHDQYGVPFWDALLSATMLQYGITTIYTENIKDFKKIKEITAINPFKR
jgi:predicted nucleic acid-binding protein